MTIIELRTGNSQQEDLQRAMSLVDRVLTAEIASAQALLDGDPSRATESSADQIVQCLASHDDLPIDESWWAPIAALGLSAIERAIVLFSVAPEVSRRAGYQYSMLEDPSQPRPTVDFLIRVLSPGVATAHEIRSLLQPTARLFALGVLKLNRTRDTDSSLAATVSPAELIAARLLRLPDDTEPAIRVVPARDADSPIVWFDDDVIATLRAVAARGHTVIHARAAGSEAVVAAAHHVAAAAGQGVVELDLGHVDPTQYDALLGRVQLVSLLNEAVCVVVGANVDIGHRLVLGLARSRPLYPVVLDIAESAAAAMPLGVLIDLTEPSVMTRRNGWLSALIRNGLSGSVTDAELNTLAQRYEFARGEIDRVVANATAIHGPASVDFRTLVSAAGCLAGAVLAGVAERVDTAASWSDIVVPETTMTELRHVAVAIRQRDTVMSAYGVGNRTRSNGAAVLFAGPSGTGKTLAASVIARELDAELYRVNLATVVSKYIGETEKNLERVFRAAQRSGVVLLFDEADAIFGKRSEIKDAHDRYANLETAYLLQRIELHPGPVILTTNVRHHLDPAFLRRFAAIVQFPEPSELERHRLWELLLGRQVPRADSLDLCRLARETTVTGGEIAAVLVDAATEAAEACEPIGHAQIDVAIARLQQRRGR